MNHKNLNSWQKAMDLVTIVYSITNNFPKREKYSLTDQIRRSAVSIPSNIAEGAGRESTNEYLRFLNIAMGSLSELETQLLLAVRLHYLNDEDVFKSLIEVRRLILGQRKYLKSC